MNSDYNIDLSTSDNTPASGATSIMIVEDDITNQKLLSELLELLDYHVEVASDGSEALDKVKQNRRYDLIFMDLMMPNMDGLEATQEIRKAGFQDLPIVGLTGNSSDRQQCLEAGMNDYLSKPVNHKAICKMIDEWTSPQEANVS